MTLSNLQNYCDEQQKSQDDGIFSDFTILFYGGSLGLFFSSFFFPLFLLR
jgi:hypothetical protein